MNFSGAATLDTSFSEWEPPEAPFGHNETPTMLTQDQANVWVYHQGASPIGLGVWVQWWRLGGVASEYVSASPGWGTYAMTLVPPL